MNLVVPSVLLELPAGEESIGRAANRSPTRANGLAAMVKQMRLYALAFQAKSNS